MNSLKLIFILCVFPVLSWGQTTQLGLGAILGNPTGVSGEVLLDHEQSVDFALAWSSSSYSGIHLHSDYLITRQQVGKAGTMPVDVYFGIGGRFVFINKGKEEDKVAIGPRAPIGVALKTVEPNLKFFAELALVLDLTPDTEADLDIGVGGRYYF